MSLKRRIIPRMNERRGKIIIEAGLNVWDHELRTAKALASAGYIVEFTRKSNVKYEKTADTFINGVPWEFKAPTADRLKAIERNIKRARWQSENIVFDCRRMKKLPDAAIEREVRKQAFAISRVSKVLYINKHGEVITIK